MTNVTVLRVSFKGMQRDLHRAAYRVKVPSKAPVNISITGGSFFAGPSEDPLDGFFSRLYAQVGLMTKIRCNLTTSAKKDAAVLFLDHFFEREGHGESWIYSASGMAKLLRCLQGVVNTKQFSRIYNQLLLEIIAAAAAWRHGLPVYGLYGNPLYLTFKQWVRRPDRLFAIRRISPTDRSGRLYKANVHPDRDRGVFRYHLGRRSSKDSRHRWVASSGQEFTIDLMIDLVRRCTFSLS